MCKMRNMHCFLHKNSNLHEDKSVSPVGIYKLLYSMGMIRLVGSWRVYMIRAHVYYDAYYYINQANYIKYR